ncbi:MAG TPA: hypothetical protein VFT29_08980 [Gemmatimonadaceae bacterium]|nr:hypothetical protein [Gemmatimonadaceae bacterium]
MRRPKMVVGLALLLFSASILVGWLRSERPVAPMLAGEVVEATATPPTPIPVAAVRTSKAARAALKRSTAELDSTHARLEHVEGLLHLVNALDAWDVQERARAAKELQTAADNLERGAKYLRLELNARGIAAAANARAAARRMQQPGALAADEFWHVTDALDAELRSLGARIKRKT